MPEKHALLSASSAARWLNCPPSAKICAENSDKDSTYAAEGTLAHSMCEIKLTAYTAAIPKRTVTTRINKIKKNALYHPEMDGYTDEYADYVKKIALSYPSKAHIAVERQVDYSNYAPEGFGTADCIIIHGSELHIIDFKYGKGIPVSAKDNPQLKLYALGALNSYGMLYAIQKIFLHIVQPRLDNFSNWEIDIQSLREWGESIKPTAQLAFEGKGEFKSGDHCRFCKLKSTCRKRADDNLKLAKYEFAKPAEITKDGEPVLSDEEVGIILSLAGNLKKWVEDIEKYALTAILNGKNISGWKAVEGRGTRQFTDIEKVPEILSSINLPAEIAYERKMLTVAQLEKAVGKTVFTEAFSSIVEKTKGKPTLALVSDKRPKYVQGTTAQEDFNNEKE